MTQRDRNEDAAPPSLLRAARERKGLSLEKLAAAAGVSKQTLWNAETQPSRLTDKTAAAVAPILGVEPKDLFKMSLPAIDVTYAVPYLRAETKKLPPSDSRDRLEHALDSHKKFAASTGALAAATDPEDPRLVGQVLALALGAERQELASGAVLATTVKGRKFILCKHEEGGLVILSEIEWRLGRENVEVVVYARPPEVIQ